MKRVLVVDDHADNRDLLRTLLHGHGYVVDEARHGAEALSLAMRRRPTLVVSDLLMPEMDGYTLLRQWKADPVLRHVPFIVYTATYTDPRDEQLAFDLGADAFLLKPAEPDIFLQTLQRVLAAADHGALEPPRMPTGDATQTRAAYDAALVRKLEAKAAQLEQTLSALRHSESRYSTLIDNSLDMILLGTPDGQILAANRATCQALGMTEAQICQAGRAGLLVHDENFASLREKRAAAGHATGEVTVIRGDGSRFVAEATTAQFRDEQGTLRVSVFMRDITEKKRAQAQREASDAQLRAAQKLQALGTLTGGIAHDFNNIVGAILGNVGLAREGLAPDQPVAEYLTQIDVAAKRARDLVQQLLQYSKPAPATSLTLHLQPLVGETLGLLRATVPSVVILDSQVTAAAALHVRGDPTQLHQVLLNLGTNAWHALQGSPGRVQVGLDAVEFAADDSLRPPGLQPGPYAHLWVRDNGCGMDEATLVRIFEPFFTTKPEGQGTGLGLAAVHGIVHAHGGAITVESQVGQGSLFNLYLPQVEPVVPAPQDAATPVFSAADGRDGLVMYVDDDEIMALLAERLLRRAGYRVATFLDATAALSAVRERPQDFAAVVTDYNMPHLTGLDLAREIAAIRRDLPVIISSGHIDETLRAHAGPFGVARLLHKERMLDDLVQLVQAVLAAEPLA